MVMEMLALAVPMTSILPWRSGTRRQAWLLTWVSWAGAAGDR